MTILKVYYNKKIFIWHDVLPQAEHIGLGYIIFNCTKPADDCVAFMSPGRWARKLEPEDVYLASFFIWP